MRRFLLGAASMAVAAGLFFPIHARADSQTTCDGANCKSVTVDDSGKLTTTTTAGIVRFTDLAASGTYGVVDALQALPANTPKFAQGAYTLSWGSCVHGSATGASYNVGSGGDYPKTPPSTSSSPTGATVTADKDGEFTCAYTLAYPSGAVPASAVSVRNDFWLINGSGKVATQVASQSVPPGGTPFVPDVPFAILAPVGLLLLVGGYLTVRQRRHRPVATS